MSQRKDRRPSPASATDPFGSNDWLCPRHRALIRHDADAALLLWQQLDWLSEQGRLATPTLQLARWHVALDVIDALLANGRAEALACLLAAAQTLVPIPACDGDLLLRLHTLLCLTADRPGQTDGEQIALSGWLALLEQRLRHPDKISGWLTTVTTCYQ